MTDPATPHDQPTISFVIVAYRSGPELTRTLPALARELRPGDEVIVLDNDPTDSPRAVIAEHLPAARLIELAGNPGFTVATNRGASESNGDIVLMLNPDATPEPGFAAAIRRPFGDRPRWGAWMPLVTCRIGGQRVVNSWSNPIHFTGIAWAGGHGRPLVDPDGSPVVAGAREVSIASGAALAVRREIWREVGGLPEAFFLYHEDTDISLRIQAAGHPIGIQPEARVDHDYDFHSSERKWFWLERNRLAMVIRNYPGPLLGLLAPALLATEVVLLLVSARQGWSGAKLRAYRDLIAWLPRLRRERREVQAARQITVREFADLATPVLDSPLIPAFARKGLVSGALRAYWRAVLALLP